MGHVLTLLRQIVQDAPNDPGTNVLLQYGAVGAMAALGMYVSLTYMRDLRAQRDAERTRAERAEAALAALNQEFREQTIPVLVRTTEAVADIMATRRSR